MWNFEILGGLKDILGGTVMRFWQVFWGCKVL